MKAVDSFFFISSLTLSLFHFLEYHGSFGSCFHYGDSFRMEQSVGGVHIPGDSHAYSAHQHNGFHMSAVNAGSGGMERLFWALPKIITQMFFVFFYKDNSMIFLSSAPGFSLTQELQGNTGCQFSSSPEESVFFQVGSFDRGLSHMSTVYTET